MSRQGIANAIGLQAEGVDRWRSGIEAHRFLFPPDAEAAASLDAPETRAALQVRRWHYPDSGELLVASRSLYPQGRLVYRTDWQRGKVGG